MLAAAIALALTAAAIHGTWNVLVKVSGDPIATFQRATLAAALVATPLVGITWWVLGRPLLVPAAVGFCVLSATLETTYLWLLSTAYRRGEISVVYPIARGSAPLISVVAGLGLLGERLTPLQLAGVVFLLFGILGVTLPQTSGRATIPALLTGVAIAGYSIVDRLGVRLTTPWLYGWLLITLVAAELYFSMRVARWLHAAEPAPRVAVMSPWQATLIGVLIWGGYLLVLWALSLAPLAVVAPVRETAIVAVAVWGVWRLRERRGAALKISGAVATLTGVALLAI